MNITQSFEIEFTDPPQERPDVVALYQEMLRERVYNFLQKIKALEYSVTSNIVNHDGSGMATGLKWYGIKADIVVTKTEAD